MLDESELWQGPTFMRVRHHVVALIMAAIYEQEVQRPRPPEPDVGARLGQPLEVVLDLDCNLFDVQHPTYDKSFLQTPINTCAQLAIDTEVALHPPAG